jgi:hypothetical protein
MKRIWSIEEQTIEDKSTGFKLEFTTETILENNPEGEIEAEEMIFKLWNEGRSRVAIFKFNPKGEFIGSNVELTPVDELTT